MPQHNISRERLFLEIWEEPILRVSQKYGISDVGLAKVCKRLSIPRPPRGYWAKIRTGQKVTKPELPPLKDDQLGNLTINPPERTDEDCIISIPRDVSAKIESLNLDSLFADLRGCNHLVSISKNNLENGRIKNGTIDISNLKCLDLRSSKSSLRRGLLLFQTIISHSLALGWQIDVVEGNGKYNTYITIGNTRVRIRITEQLNRTEDPKKSYSFSKYYEYSPTGNFRFVIEEYWPGYAQKTWSDTKTAKLDFKLKEILIGIWIVSEGIRLRSIEWENQRKIAEERRRWEAIVSREKKLEEIRIKKLLRNVDNWHQCQRIRGFIDHLKTHDPCISKEKQAWINWAIKTADSKDPFLNGYPQFGDLSKNPELL